MLMLPAESCLLEQQKVEKPEKRKAAGESNGDRQHGALGPARSG